MQFSRLHPRRLLIVEAIAAVLALSACGGGSEGLDETGEAAVESTADAGAPAADATGAGAPAETAGDVDAEATATTGVADAVVTGEADAPEPEPGEQGFGSMEAQSKAFEELEVAQGLVAPEETDDATATADAGDASGDDRESAQSLTNISGRTHFAKPKVAALDYSSSTSLEKRKLLAKFNLVVLGGRGGADLNAFTSGIKSINPNARIGYYVAFNELLCSASSGSYHYPMVQAANKTDYWLRYASGSKAQWTTSYNACDMNISGWGRKDSNGRTWMQTKAKFDYEKVFKNAPKIEFAFSDNTFGMPRVSADWKRIRTNQSKTDSSIVTAQRQGQAAYWAALRSYKSGLKIIGNANNDLSFDEYRYKLNGAMQEAAMGKSWSLETWAGWDRMMERYRRQLKYSSSPKDVLLEVRGSFSNYKLMRYGLASALLENGWFMYLPSSGTFVPKWFDEFEAPIGKPVESPPTAPKSNGIWARKYENGIVLVNPSKTSTRSIYIGSSYKRLKGTQDPYVNNGAAQSTVTLGPRQGLIMIKR